MKFTTKLTTLILGIFLSSSIIIIYFVYVTNEKILREEIMRTLEGHAFHTMEKIDRMFYERLNEMTALAEDPVISSKTSTPEQLSKKIKEYHQYNKMFTSMTLLDMNRVVLADSSGKGPGEQHDLHDYWFDIAKGKRFVIYISQSAQLKRPSFHFAYAVRDKKGTPLSVIVSSLPADYLYNIVRSMSDVHGGIHSIYENFLIELLDRNGLVLYSNYNLKGILSDISPNWEFVKKRLDAGELLGSEVHQHLKEEEITSFINEPGYLSFAGNGWNLVISVSAKKAFEPVLILKNKLIAIFSIGGIVILFSIVIFSRKLTRPLKTLHEASIEIGRGDLDRKINIASKDEIGQLARSFNSMIKDLKESREKWLAYNMELEMKVEERTLNLQRINEQLQMELIECGKIEKVLLKLKDAAEVASQAKTDFISNMSHELRTPLNSILGFSEVLHDEHYGSQSVQQKEFLSHIMKSGNHLLSLINDLLDLSKVESGMMQLTMNRFLLKGVVSSIVIMMREKAYRHGIDVSINIEPDADIHIEADERKIKQIMFNLLSNALKFTPDGGSVSVQARRVQRHRHRNQSREYPVSFSGSYTN